MSLDLAKTFKGYISENNGKYSLKHNSATFYRIVPYSTNLDSKSIEKLDFKSFDGIIGRCYRAMINKDLPEDLSEENFNLALKERITQKVLEKVQMKPELQDRFMAMIESMFFNGEELTKYSPLAQAYLFWKTRNSGLDNIADFIYELFVTEQVGSIWQQEGGFTENIFQTLINSALPPLKNLTIKKSQTTAEKRQYKIQHNEIVQLFEEDFKYLYTHDKQGFLKESDKLFKFYYFLYVTQMGFSLNNFFGDNTALKPLFFTLESEIVSENRKTVKHGWDMIAPKLANLMSHSAALDILNRMEMFGQSGYNYLQLSQLYEGADAQGRQQVVADLDEVIDRYVSAVGPEKKQWSDFEPEKQRIEKNPRYNDFEKKIVEFFQRIEFQFENSSRASKRKSFSNWFIFFCKENFLKNRGRNGYILNLSQEMFIFLTRICIGGRQKVRLNELIDAFAKRGIYFDDASKKAMIGTYEKINVIEKKSDSGDAQYIRQIL